MLLQVDDGSGEALLPGAVDYESALAAASADMPADPSPDDLYILYTGGTTGMPKGVLWRQADIFCASLGGRNGTEEWSSLDEIAAAAVNGGMKVLPAAPFMHGAAHWLAFNALTGGNTVVIPSNPTTLDSADVWSTVQAEGVAVMLIVGDAFARPLLDELDRGDYDVSSMFMLVSGGAALGAPLKARFLDSIPQMAIMDGLGSSETGTQARQVVGAGQTTSTGTFPVIEGRRMAVPGDRARIDADGLLELHGRDSVTINSGGEKIFAEEVEQALAHHPAVYDVVVAGRPSERWGSEVVAVVQLSEGAEVSIASLLDECGRHVARYKLPKDIIFVDKVMRSPAGKADYRWARQVAEDHSNRA